MKKLFKWIGIVLLSPVVLFVVLVALLYVPPIQNWVVQQVASTASKKTGMDISVEHVDMSFPLDLQVDGVRIVKEQDTIADIRSTIVDVKLWPLFSGDIVLNELRLDDAHINTLDFIGDLRMQGFIGSLSLSSPGIDATALEMELRNPRMKNTDLTVYMSDTAAIDTSTVGWHIRFDRFDFEQTRLCIVMDSTAVFATDASPTDTAATVPTRIEALLPKATLRQGNLHLGFVRFAFGGIDWHEGRLSMGSYGKNDDNAFSLSDMELQIDSLFSYKEQLRVGIAQASMKEENTGVTLHQLQGRIAKNGDDISLRNLLMNASAAYDGQPVTLRADIDGDTRQMDIRKLSVSVPTKVHAEASGQLHNILDMERLTADVSLSANVFETMKADGMQLPAGLSLQADAKVAPPSATEGATIAFTMNVKEALSGAVGSALVSLQATLHGNLSTLIDKPEALPYEASLSTHGLNLRRFMPAMGVGMLSTDVTLHGTGIPSLSTDGTNSGHLEADVNLHSLHYDQWQIDSVQATATIEGNNMQICTVSRNRLVSGTFDADVQMGKNNILAKVSTSLQHADLFALGIVDHPTVIGLDGDFDIDTDKKLRHKLSALMSDIYIRDSVQTHHPERIGILVKTSTDTTVVRLQSGDFIVKADAQGNYEQLLPRLSALSDSIATQLKNRTIDQVALKQLLPTGRLYITAQKGNPIAAILNAQADITFDHLNIDLHASPLTGLNGQLDVLKLNTGSMLLDSIRLSLVEKAKGLTFNGYVANAKRNPTGTFRILYDGFLQQHGASLGVRYFDELGQLNIRIGSKVEMVSLPGTDGDATGLRFQLIPSRPTLGYKEFTLNDDNYLLLHDNLKIDAHVNLLADDGTRILLYSGDSENSENSENSEDSEDSAALLQDLTVSVSNLDLGELTSGLVMLPAISGTLNGDYHLIMDQEHNISVASDMDVTKMVYEGSPVGNLGSEFVYLLREDGTHVVDATLMLDDAPIGSLQGSYLDGKRLDADLELTHMPLSIVNGFMPDQLLGFEGFADGTLSVNGQLSKLQMNGNLMFTNGYLVSTPYGMRMRFGDTPLQMTDSKLILDGFTLYADNDGTQGAPLSINGSVDFYGQGDDALSLRLSARNFQLVKAKQKKESVAYGKMFVNIFARLNGNLEKLRLRGRLDVLGTTDLNYVLLDSPLSTDNQMDELVKFTDFSDTTQTVVARPEIDALDLDVQLRIDEGAHVRCALNAEQTNYVDLLGGGDLRMRMDADGLNLTGRYTINNGTMKYSLPIIPLKTFTLAQGSYVEFTGRPDNPTLNITATERHRAAVSNESDGQSRNVMFDCGVVITQTLENMGLAFTINAPEDMQVQNDLNSMSREQRGKLAVTMLTTGMYLADGNTSAFSMNSALSSFLQSEINNITSGALKTVDLQVGLGSTTDAAGQSHTDYSFSFAKRFWNNRLSVQLGGKVSTGSEVEGMQQSFFDNVTMEYRLSPTSNKYVKLFYNQNVYDWLEGYTGEYGGGFVWKRKLDRLIDIFKPTPSLSRREGRPNPSRPTTDPSQREEKPTTDPSRPTPNPSQREGSMEIPVNVVSPQDSIATNDSIRNK